MHIRNSPNSDTIINIGSETISLGAGEMSVSTDVKTGNYIVGPLSITSSFTDIRWSSGLFKFNSLLISTMPSNIINPVPVFELDIPVKGMNGFRSVLNMIIAAVS